MTTKLFLVRMLLTCVVYVILSIASIVVMARMGYPPKLFVGLPCLALLVCAHYFYLFLVSIGLLNKVKVGGVCIIYLILFILVLRSKMQTHDWPRQVNIARQWAETGDVEQQYILADLYDKKEQRANAFKWYSVAANNGHCKAQEKLAYFYRKGKVVEVDFGMARYWEQMAMECYKTTKNDK